MATKLTYLASPGTIDTLFKKIKQAAVPERFDTDYVQNTLNIKGGTGRACMPFLKRLGLLKGDGSPTENFKLFRNDSSSGAVIAAAMKNVYAEVFQVNEDAHKLNDSDLKGIIVQVTGLPADSRTVDLTLSTFKYLKKHAKFDVRMPAKDKPEDLPPEPEHEVPADGTPINLSYTFYLNLPNTNDISVFNAIFKATRQSQVLAALRGS